MSTAEYRETAPPLLRLGAGADDGPGAFFDTGLPAALPYVGLSHVDPDRVVRDPFHNRVRVDTAAEPRMPVLLLELGAEDGRDRAAPQLHQLQQHGPKLGVRLVQQPLVVHEQAERAVLVDQLPLIARALAALPPEVFEVGLPDVARPHPPAVDGLREYQEGGVLSVPVRPCSTTFSQRPTNPHVASSVTDNLRGRSPERSHLDVLAYSYSPC